jgi:hypothetical protein
VLSRKELDLCFLFLEVHRKRAIGGNLSSKIANCIGAYLLKIKLSRIPGASVISTNIFISIISIGNDNVSCLSNSMLLISYLSLNYHVIQVFENKSINNISNVLLTKISRN